jgi:uncharacterized protein (TIGR02421 family)
MSLSSEHQIIREISDKIVVAQGPIRILDAIKWDDEIKQEFFKNKCEKLPSINKEYYERHPLPYDPNDKIVEFRTIVRETKNRLGEYSNISALIESRCDDYCKAIHMLSARGTPLFSYLAMELYGSPDDAFYPKGPRLSELGVLLADTLKLLNQELQTEADEKKYSALEAMTILQGRLSQYFTNHNQMLVKISDNIVADAAAGADTIRMNQNVSFSERDLRYLEVHEGWVHLGTTLNGAEQPLCTFLGKGSPSSSVTQEGLAIINEIFTFSSYPRRLLKVTNRVAALEAARKGADFIEVFRFLKEQGFDDDESYTSSMRAFRGSLPANTGPFTKDLSYAKGFVLIYNYIRLAVKQGLVKNIPIFFVGKTLLEEIQPLTELMEEGIITMPMYLPPNFRDLSALSCWMSMSLFLNKFDLEAVAKHYSMILHS